MIAGYSSGPAGDVTPLDINEPEMQHRLDFIEFLLKSGANPNIKDNGGRTVLAVARALHKKALIEGKKQVAGFLLRAIELLKKYRAE